MGEREGARVGEAEVGESVGVEVGKPVPRHIHMMMGDVDEHAVGVPVLTAERFPTFPLPEVEVQLAHVSTLTPPSAVPVAILPVHHEETVGGNESV